MFNNRSYVIGLMAVTIGLGMIAPVNAASVTYSVDGVGAGSICGASGCSLTGTFTYDDSGSPTITGATDISLLLVGEHVNELFSNGAFDAGLSNRQVITNDSGAPLIASFIGSGTSGLLSVCVAPDENSVCGDAYNAWALFVPFGDELASGSVSIAPVPLPGAIALFVSAIVGFGVTMRRFAAS